MFAIINLAIHVQHVEFFTYVYNQNCTFEVCRLCCCYCHCCSWFYLQKSIFRKYIKITNISYCERFKQKFLSTKCIVQVWIFPYVFFKQMIVNLDNNLKLDLVVIETSEYFIVLESTIGNPLWILEVIRLGQRAR